MGALGIWQWLIVLLVFLLVVWFVVVLSKALMRQLK